MKNLVEEHLPGYQRRDWEVIDYQQYQLGNTGLTFRGPDPQALMPGGYIVCVGAAQTFGCLCESPYPKLIEEKLGMPVLNLGYGGAGPLFFLKHKSLHEYIRNARAVVIQVMSGRSEDNVYFKSGGLEYLHVVRTGKRTGATKAYNGLLDDNIRSVWKWHYGSGLVRSALAQVGHSNVRRAISETRSNWVRHMRDLLNLTNSPKVLLWFSKRTPDYRESYKNAASLLGEFPQLIDRKTLQKVVGSADCYVECVSIRGMPQRLYSRFTGQPIKIDPANDRPDLGGRLLSENGYYPTPEMHEDAFESLAGKVSDILKLSDY